MEEHFLTRRCTVGFHKKEALDWLNGQFLKKYLSLRRESIFRYKSLFMISLHVDPITRYGVYVSTGTSLLFPDFKTNCDNLPLDATRTKTAQQILVSMKNTDSKTRPVSFRVHFIYWAHTSNISYSHLALTFSCYAQGMSLVSYSDSVKQVKLTTPGFSTMEIISYHGNILQEDSLNKKR